MHYFAKTHKRAILVTFLLLVLATASIAGTAPKNVILLIGDGMGFGHVTSARLADNGTQGKLLLDTMPVTGFAITCPHGNVVTDSAASGTALATGVKTKNGSIGVDAEKKPVKSILEVAQGMGKSTGVVTNDAIVGATPSAFVANVADRGMHWDIAAQMSSSRVNVLLGGGKLSFVPKVEGKEGREDGRDLLADMRKRGYDVVETRDQMLAAKSDRVLGLFTWQGGMDDINPVPSVAEMLQCAVTKLSTGSRGFFVICESAGCDHGGHGNNIDAVLGGVKQIDEALQVALDYAQKNNDTLIIVTADHETGGLATQNPSKEKPDTKFNPQWTGGGHTGNMVPIYAFGPGSERFSGTHQNTDIPKIIAELWGQKLN